MKRKLFCLALSVWCLCSFSGCTATREPFAPVSTSEPAEPPAPDLAAIYTNTLSLEEQAAQIFFVRCPDVDATALVREYDIGGYILFGRDFDGQTPDSVRETIDAYQSAVKTPLLIGVDEEGGTVVRVSRYPAFREKAFYAPRSLIRQGGVSLLVQDTQEKDSLLSSLGINVNLAPVCDFSNNPQDFIYPRACGDTPEETAEYVRAMVEQMTRDNMGMVLKHFPGYGNNVDTHTGIALDERPLSQFQTVDFLPFTAGIAANAQAVLVNHNIVACMDDKLPASLSPAVHKVLRDELNFSGVIMTDDLIMNAIAQYTDGEEAAVLAVQAGNDMLISSDFATQYQAVLSAVRNGVLTEEQIYNAALHIIQWKMQLGLL